MSKDDGARMAAADASAAVDDDGAAFIAASLATVVRIDQRLRALGLGPAPLPAAAPWGSGDLG